jgi:hypothetical protein
MQVIIQFVSVKETRSFWPATSSLYHSGQAEIVISLYGNLRLNSRFDNDGYVNNMVPDR